MKKLFLTICFLLPCFSHAAIKQVRTLDDAKKQEQIFAPIQEIDRSSLYSGFSSQDWEEFIASRLLGARKEAIPQEQRSSSAITSVSPADESFRKDNKPKESLFKKIYQNAINRITSQDQKQDSKPLNLLPNIKGIQQVKSLSKATIPVTIPYINKVINVAAVPHIPYFFSDIEVLSTGGVVIEDNFVVINSKASPYTKKFNKYLINRNKEKQKLDIELLNVHINSQEVEYQQLEDFDNYVLAPKNNDILPSGVYEYKIKYILKNNLTFYDDFDEFFFNITGSNTLLIARAGVFVTMPQGFEVVSQNPFILFNNLIVQKNIVVIPKINNTYGYISTLPIMPKSGFYLISAIKKEGLVPLNFSQRFWNHFSTHQDVIFAIIGFFVILASYIISLKTLNLSFSKQNIKLNKTAAMIRYVYKEKLDINTFVSFLLGLYKKNIIDIIKNDQTVLLIKKTDLKKNLSSYEKKSLEELFINNESVISITSYNLLKIKRAMQKLNTGLKKSLMLFVYKLNARYLLFSFLMLFATILCISAGHFNNVQVLGVTIISVICFVAATALFFVKNNNKIINTIIKVLAIVINMFIVSALSIFIGLGASFFIFLTVVTIFVFSLLFVKRSGLLHSYISEMSEYNNFLTNLLKKELTPKDFADKQANIFALDLAGSLKYSPSFETFYKLDLAQEILDTYNRKK